MISMISTRYLSNNHYFEPKRAFKFSPLHLKKILQSNSENLTLTNLGAFAATHIHKRHKRVFANRVASGSSGDGRPSCGSRRVISVHFII